MEEPLWNTSHSSCLQLQQWPAALSPSFLREDTRMSNPPCDQALFSGAVQPQTKSFEVFVNIGSRSSPFIVRLLHRFNLCPDDHEAKLVSGP
jgi:hypothetical protein